MTTPLTVTSQVEQKVILHNVSWQLYEHLLAEHKDVCNPRFAYDRGVLEIMVLSFEHEQLNRLIADIFGVLADELAIDYINAGSTTFKREDVARGFEPDTAFYVQHVEEVRGKVRLDPTIDPPPDVVIEVDISSPSLNKLPIFAALGIPEIWRYDNNTLTILRLDHGDYSAQEESLALAGATRTAISGFIDEGKRLTRSVWLRHVRAWVRQQGARTDEA
jgi:Uma2 family endonuclease